MLGPIPTAFGGRMKMMNFSANSLTGDGHDEYDDDDDEHDGDS